MSINQSSKQAVFPKCERDPLFRYQNYITWVPGKLSKWGKWVPRSLSKTVMYSPEYHDEVLPSSIALHTFSVGYLRPSSSGQPHFSLRSINCTLAKESGGNRGNVEHKRERWGDENSCGRLQHFLAQYFLWSLSLNIELRLKEDTLSLKKPEGISDNRKHVHYREKAIHAKSHRRKKLC